MKESVRVRITGEHPWTGYTGIVISVQRPKIGILPPMAVVRLDHGQDCPDRHECFVERKQLQVIGKT